MSAASGAGMFAAMGASAASSIVTGYAQSKAYKAQGQYQQSLAETNASMADLAEKETLQAGDVAAGRKNEQTKQAVGSELAEQGASGVDVASGSAALVRGGTKLAGDIDELTIRNNAARAAFGYKVQGIQDKFQGQFAQLTAKSEAEQSLLSGGLGAISGPLSIQSNYLRWSRSSDSKTSSVLPTYTGSSGDAADLPQSYMPFSTSSNKLSLDLAGNN